MDSRSPRSARCFPLALLIGLSTLELTACSRGVRPQLTAKPVIAERLEPAASTPSDPYSGDVHAHHESALSFRVSGKIVGRYVTLGETVRRGELLARLDASDASLQAQAAAAAVGAARSNYATARQDLARYAALVRTGAVSRTAYDHEQDRLATAESTYRQSKRRYQLRIDQLGYTRLRADHSGVITAVHAEVGQVVAAGQTVLNLAWSGGREVYIDVPENRIGEFGGAGQIDVTVPGAGRSYHGFVREVSAAADPATRTFLVKIAIVHPDPEVRLGMTAEVTVNQAADPRQLIIPMSALYHSGTAPAVWVVNTATHRLELAPVHVQGYTERGVVIGSGLKSGTEVVLKGVNELYRGEPVEVTAPIGSGA